jgi:ADP-heptose:LPS heptosyltransferase
MNQRMGAIKAPRVEELHRDIEERVSDAAIVFFGTAEESSAIQNFRQTLPEQVQARCHWYRGDLWTTAALIRKCCFFVSGDAGLMHIAAAFQIPQKVYYRATNPTRTRPRHPNVIVVIDKECVPYRYPFKAEVKT